MKYLIKVFSLFAALTTGALAQSIPFPGPGIAALEIVAPVSLGHNNTGVAGCTSATTQTLTTTSPIKNGDLVVVVVDQVQSTAINVSTISDGTNSYVKATNGTNASEGNNIELWYKANASPVSSGATITVTWGSTVSFCQVIAARVSNINLVSPLDVTPTSTNGNSTTPSIVSGTLAQAVEIMFGAIFYANTASYSESAGFSTLASDTNAGGPFNVVLSYQITASTVSKTYAPTLGTGRFWTQILASFK